MAILNEITMTLFKNQGKSPGLTLSVTPNYSTGGKRINFSFKGDNTLTLKAVRDLSTAGEQTAGAIREMIGRPKFQSLYANRSEYDIMRFSKGYVSSGSGSKGPTVPALAVLMRDGSTWGVYLDFYVYDYVCDELTDDTLTASQVKQGALVAHRWRRPPPENSNNIWDFLGDN